MSFSFVLEGPSGTVYTPVHRVTGPSEVQETYKYPVTGLEPGATYVVTADVTFSGSGGLYYLNGVPPQFRTLARLDVLLRGLGKVASTPAGIDCGAVCGVDLPVGGGLTLTATPAPGYRFGHWDGDACLGSIPTCAAWVTTWARTTAVFDQATLVTVTRRGSGSGAVTSAPGGVACGETCSATFDPGQIVTLTATPEQGSRFAGWSGVCTATKGPCTFTTAPGAAAVEATFVKVATLTVARKGRGKVTDASGAIDCGASCTATFDDGATATLRATPTRGYAFAGWGGSCTGKTPTCSVDVTGAQAVQATFKRKPKKKRR